MTELPTKTQSEPRFTILIDGECPLCAKEASLMRWLDGGRGRLAIVDIAAPGFDAGRYGTTYEAVMGEIHGVVPGNRLVTGVEVFRRAYAAIGWGWVLAPTAWPGIRWVSDAAYRWFARNRLWLTGRKDCGTGACKVK
jgi:predicted DCC family thiol-disulfide oxidoreductase YuxK